MKTLSSLTHDTVKYLVSLASAKGRAVDQEFIAQGIRTCAAFLQGNIQLLHLYATHDALEKALTIADESKITLVSAKVMEKISPHVNPEGVLGLFKIPNNPGWNTLHRGIVLVDIQDPGNMGTLIRTAAALNLSSIVIVGGASVWSPKVVQSSAGTLGNVALFEASWEELMAHKGNINLYALVVAGGTPISSQASRDALLVIGNEGRGLSDAQINSCDARITLPMPGKTESLNAAVAGSIAAYQLFT